MERRSISTAIIILLIISSITALDLSRRYLSGEFGSNENKLEVLYSSEKAGWLESVVNQFEDEWNANNSGSNLDVVMTAIGTGKGTIQIANSASQPTIWSPASRFWLPILNLQWEENHDSAIVDVNAPSLVSSPTIIATWKDYQRENNINGLQDLHELALSDPDFTFAHTDPYSSNSGFASVIMEAAVAADKEPEDLTIDDLSTEEVQQWMRELESRAVQYGSSTGFLAKLMANEGPSQLKVALMYENLVVEKNKELRNKIENGDLPENQTLVAVYPEEGTVINDHPFVILDAPWVDEQDTELAEDFINFLQKSEIQENAVEFGFRPAEEVNQEIIEEVFSIEAGVKSDISNIKIYSINNLQGTVLERIPDLWSATRSRSLDEGDVSANQLNFGDYIIPGILGIIFVLMIFYPVYNRIRRYYR